MLNKNTLLKFIISISVVSVAFMITYFIYCFEDSQKDIKEQSHEQNSKYAVESVKGIIYMHENYLRINFKIGNWEFVLPKEIKTYDDKWIKYNKPKYDVPMTIVVHYCPGKIHSNLQVYFDYEMKKTSLKDDEALQIINDLKIK